MSGFGVPEDGSASLALALALVVASFTPLWALLLWVMKSSSPPWRLLAQGKWLKCLAWLACSLAGILLANIGWIWVYNDLLGPGRSKEQEVIFGTAAALGVLWILGLAWAQKREVRARVPTPTARVEPPKLTRGMALFVLGVWIVLAGGFAAWKFGPLATEPASLRDKLVLALACVAVATLIMVFVNVFRKARRTEAMRGDGSTGIR